MTCKEVIRYVGLMQELLTMILVGVVIHPAGGCSLLFVAQSCFQVAHVGSTLEGFPSKGTLASQRCQDEALDYDVIQQSMVTLTPVAGRLWSFGGSFPDIDQLWLWNESSVVRASDFQALRCGGFQDLPCTFNGSRYPC